VRGFVISFAYLDREFRIFDLLRVCVSLQMLEISRGRRSFVPVHDTSTDSPFVRRALSLYPPLPHLTSSSPFIHPSLFPYTPFRSIDLPLIYYLRFNSYPTYAIPSPHLNPTNPALYPTSVISTPRRLLPSFISSCLPHLIYVLPTTYHLPTTYYTTHSHSLAPPSTKALPPSTALRNGTLLSTP
jgi:hypothetical protein